MIRYPDLNSPSVDNSRKRLRGSSQEPKVENEFLQAVSLIGKKREKKKEENEVALPHSAAPVVTSKPPPPIATSELDDEYGSRSQGNVVSLFSKNKKTPTSIEKGKEIDHILKTSRAKPYEMLGIDDNYNEFNTSTADKKAIARAFHKLSNRVHPDKNEDPRATKAFQRLNQSVKRLKKQNEAFAENAYSSASDPLTDESHDSDGHDQDGDVVMDDIPAQQTTPGAYHVKIHKKCTPYIHQLIDDPYDHEAASAIDRCNEKVKLYNIKHSMYPRDGWIFYGGFVVEIVSAQTIRKSFRKKRDHSDKEYQIARNGINEANQNIKQWVESNYYPREWVVQFQLTRSAELEHTMAAGSDTGDKLTMNNHPEPTAEVQRTKTADAIDESIIATESEARDESIIATESEARDESISITDSDASWIPGQTMDGQMIKTYHAMKSYLGGIWGCTVVIQPDEKKAIGVIKPGSEIGKEAVRAFFEMENKPPDYGIQSDDFKFKDARYIDRIVFVGLRPNDDIIENPEHCDAVCEVSLERSIGGKRHKSTRWLRWNKLRKLMGHRVADKLIASLYRRERIPLRSRDDYVRSKRSIAERGYARSNSTIVSSSESESPKFKSSSGRRRAITSKSNHIEDPDIEILMNHIASLQVEVKNIRRERRERRPTAQRSPQPIRQSYY